MTLKVGIVGAGYVTSFHLRAWAKAGAEVVAIMDPDGARAHRRASEFGIANVFNDFSLMLERGGLDALDIASPRQAHAEHALAAATHGLPALCQKPLAPSLKEAEALVRMLNDRIPFMVHENWRFRPEYRRIAAWRDAGRIGPLRHATFTMRTSALLPDARGERPVMKRQSFMVTEHRLAVAEVSIHHLDVARWLLGKLSLRDAWIMRTARDLPGETAMLASLVGESGAPVVISGDMTTPGAPSEATDAVELVGARGQVVFANGELSLFPADGGPGEREVVGPGSAQASFDAAIAHFVETLACGGVFETSVADNLETLRLVEEIYQSARRIDAFE